MFDVVFVCLFVCFSLFLQAEELCRLVSLHHAVGPPTLCCLKLGE